MCGFKKYIRGVRRHLKCSRPMKDKVINCVTGFMEEVLRGDTSVSYRDLCKEFGKTPRQMADSYIEELPLLELRKYEIKKQLINVTVFLLSLLLIYLIYRKLVNLEVDILHMDQTITVSFFNTIV